MLSLSERKTRFKRSIKKQVNKYIPQKLLLLFVLSSSKSSSVTIVILFFPCHLAFLSVSGFKSNIAEIISCVVFKINEKEVKKRARHGQ